MIPFSKDYFSLAPPLLFVKCKAILAYLLSTNRSPSAFVPTARLGHSLAASKWVTEASTAAAPLAPEVMTPYDYGFIPEATDSQSKFPSVSTQGGEAGHCPCEPFDRQPHHQRNERLTYELNPMYERRDYESV